MEKLDSSKLENVLEDVRKSYRLLALYQQRLLDIVKYIGNKYNQEFNSGWAKFSKHMNNGNRAKIDAWSWDWLTMYLYEFNMGHREIGEHEYWFKIVHQADTGFYDKEKTERIQKTEIDQFETAEKSKSRLFLVLSRSEGCPKKNLLSKHLSSVSDGLVHNGDWMAVPYDMKRFIDKQSTDKVLKEFNSKVLSYFNVEILPEVEPIAQK